MDPTAIRERFLDGLASAAGVDRDALVRPAPPSWVATIGPGSQALACYRVGDHLVVWADPAVVDRAREAGLIDVDHRPAMDRRCPRAVGRRGRLPPPGHRGQQSAGRPAHVAGTLSTDYRQWWLSYDDEVDRAAVRAFVERCDPDEVDDAALDEFDDVREEAINVVVPASVGRPTGDRGPIVAYASASSWDWDEVFADIGCWSMPTTAAGPGPPRDGEHGGPAAGRRSPAPLSPRGGQLRVAGRGRPGRLPAGGHARLLRPGCSALIRPEGWPG